MRDLNEVAPDFAWLDASGQTQTLGAWKDRFRVVLLFSHDEGAFAAWEKRQQERAFIERDLRILAVGPCAALPSLGDEDGSIARLFGVPTGATAFFLIGKDGTIKCAQNTVPDLDELWAQIDAMTMRQREMRERS